MQQGHLRYKQLSRARHEMAFHKRYMFAKKINESIRSSRNGVIKVMNSVSDSIFNISETEPARETPEIKDIIVECIALKD